MGPIWLLLFLLVHYEKEFIYIFFLLQIFGILCPWCLVCCDSHHDQSRSCHWKCLRDHLYFYVLCNRIWPSCGTNFCKFFFAWQFTIGHNLSFDTFIHEIVDFSRETFEYCKIFKEGNKNMENIFSFWQIQGFFFREIDLFLYFTKISWNFKKFLWNTYRKKSISHKNLKNWSKSSIRVLWTLSSQWVLG